MNRIRRADSIIVFVLVMSLGITPAFSGSRDRGVRQEYDGETLFRGIYYGIGPAASLLPEVWEDPVIVSLRAKAGPGAVEDVATRVSQYIRTNRFDFFPRFALAMQSGDHVLAAEALAEADELLRGAIRDIYDTDEETASLGSVSGTCAVLALVLVVWKYVAAWEWKYLPDAESTETELREDFRVDSLVRRLR